MNEYVLIEEGKAWAKVTASEGGSVSQLKEQALKSLPHRAERIANSIVRLKLGIPQEVLT